MMSLDKALCLYIWHDVSRFGMMQGRMQKFVKGGANKKMPTSIYTPPPWPPNRGAGAYFLSVKWHILGVKWLILGTVLVQKGGGPGRHDISRNGIMSPETA
jgi:hypothetical protein